MRLSLQSQGTMPEDAIRCKEAAARNPQGATRTPQGSHHNATCHQEDPLGRHLPPGRPPGPHLLSGCHLSGQPHGPNLRLPGRRTLPGCCQKFSRKSPGHWGPSGATRTPQGSRQDATRHQEDPQEADTTRKHGLVSKKVLILTKWLFQPMNCIVSKCKFCALFYLLISTLLYWNCL